MKRRSRIHLLVVAAAVAVSTACAGQPGPANIPVVAIGKVTESESVEVKRYTGHVTSSSSVSLVARVSGELVRMGFKEGENVAAGQLLFELDPVRYEAEVRNVEARVAEYEARLSYAELSYKRASELFRQNAGTKDALDSTESEHRAAKAALLAAEAQLITAKDDLENTRIVSPISGKIGVTSYTEGNYLTPNSGTIATVIQMNPLRVSFAMSNRDFLAMFGTEQNLKDRADIRLRLADDSMYELRGHVEFVDNRANQRTDTIQIFAKFENPDGKLVPGSTVTVLLSRRNGSVQPAVLPSAVMHDSKAAYVYVVDGENRVERRDIELGAGDNRVQLIKSGLTPGEMVIIDGMHKTRPGGTIEPEFQQG